MLKLFRIPISFFVIGICWALFSNGIIAFFTEHLNYYSQDVYRSLNKFIFVLVATLILYYKIKKQEYKLLRSEEDYRNLFESNPNPMWVYEKESLKFVNVNEAAIKKYNFSRSKFLQMTIDDIRPPGERDKLHEHLRHVPEQGVNVSGTWKHITGLGEIINVSITSHNILFNNQLCKLVMANDITELIAKESKLQDAYEKIKNRNKALLQVAWANSHELRKPVCSVLSLTNLLKESTTNEQERKEYLQMLESCSIELDELLKRNNHEIDNLKIEETF
jgi:PAS domain S-box-containing protein